jgi:ubiquinone biosynthesis protein
MARCNDAVKSSHWIDAVSVRRGVKTAAVLARRLVPAVAQRRAARGEAVSVALRRAMGDLGPTYVKLGQLIASSPGLFPDVLANELRSLLDEVPPISAEQVAAVITAELGAAPEELFEAFDWTPLASASIAQVHAATLPGGDDVVVKVQRPGIAGLIDADLRILGVLARGVERLSSKGRMANPVAVVEDFDTTIHEELSFVVEGRSMERFAEVIARSPANKGVRVPTVRWRYTTPRVLTMERIHGYKVDDLAGLGATGWDLAGALKRGVRAWMEAALEHGFFHGDVHAGNLMLDTDGNTVFLDFGIMGRLDDTTRDVVRRGLPALLVERDFEAVATAIYEMGAVLKPADLEQSARDIAEIVGPILDRPLSEISYGAVLVDIVRIGTSYEVRLPRELVLVAKQLLYFERYAKLMAPDWSILDDPDLIGFLFEGVSDAASPSPAEH